MPYQASVGIRPVGPAYPELLNRSLGLILLHVLSMQTPTSTAIPWVVMHYIHWCSDSKH